MKNTKHSNSCNRVFKNYDNTCPRCIELINGAKSRDGWQKSYYSNKARENSNRLKAIKSHDCKKSGCLSICVAFDW